MMLHRHFEALEKQAEEKPQDKYVSDVFPPNEGKETEEPKPAKRGKKQKE